jgi:hypothetical protein
MLTAMRFTLRPHPGTRREPVASIEVELVRPAHGEWGLRYSILGAIGAIRWPAAAAPVRSDELWRHTCCEAFVAAEDGRYVEFNFSPSGAWAAYAFDSYRAGMRALDVDAVRIETETAPAALTLNASLRLPASIGARLALAAVIEHAEGAISYWALAHPPGAPDFHHPASFTAQLPVHP